jgi:hypothetical protein
MRASGEGRIMEVPAPRKGTVHGSRLAAAIAVVGAAVIVALFHGLRHDDAYITFQYARNLATGVGYVFNPGEPVQGASSPLFTWLMAVVYLLLGDVVATAAVVVNAFAVGAQAWILYRMLRDAAPYTAVAVAAFAVLDLFSTHFLLALETGTATALALATVWSLHAGRTRGCGLFLALAFLCRNDAALLVPVVVVVHAWRHRKLPWDTLLIAGTLVAPWLLFSQLYFGSVLPHTLGAKTGVSTFGEYLESYAWLFARAPGGPFLPVGVETVVVALLIAAGLRFVWRHARGLLPLVSYAILLWLAYAVIGPPTSQHWHMQVPRTVAALLMVIGVLGTLERLAGAPAWRPLRAAVPVLAAAYAVVLAHGMVEFARSVKTSQWLGERDGRYREVAAWVVKHVRPDQRFLAREIGTLGYLTRLRMIDPYGLINETNDYPRTHDLESLFALIAEYEPDLVLLDNPRQGRRWEARSDYRMVKNFPWVHPWATLMVRDPSVLRDGRP